MARCSTPSQGCLYAEFHTEGCLRTCTVITSLSIQTQEAFFCHHRTFSFFSCDPCVFNLRQSLMITLELVAHLLKSPKCWDYWHVIPRPYLFIKIVLLLLLLLFLWGRRLNSRSHKQGFDHWKPLQIFIPFLSISLEGFFFSMRCFLWGVYWRSSSDLTGWHHPLLGLGSGWLVEWHRELEGE